MLNSSISDEILRFSQDDKVETFYFLPQSKKSNTEFFYWIASSFLLAMTVENLDFVIARTRNENVAIQVTKIF